MTRDEIRSFKFNDSDHARAWRVPHSAFLDRTARAAQARHSIEFRTIAYFGVACSGLAAYMAPA